MRRDIYLKLLKWRKSSRRKPLIVQGARQVGKTFLLKEFAKNEYKNFLYLNFDEDTKLVDFFTDKLKPQEILKKLEIYTEEKIDQEKTLIIFDEIQESSEALNSLKYFYEDPKTKNYHIVAAGSLLGIKLASDKGFPVGKVSFLEMYSMTFFEFLTAMNKNKLRDYLESIDSMQPLDKPLHEELIELLKKYFFIGGMPEAIGEYLNSQDFQTVREIHKEILEGYELDFAKHAPTSQIMKISSIWKQIPAELAKENKKFFINSLDKNARFREYESALQWLYDARLVHKSYKISTARLPLNAYSEEKFFKIYMHDSGLLAAMSKLPASVILDKNDIFTEFKGALTENFVAQELCVSYDRDLNYWASNGSAELDFILSKENKIYPLEVKSGESKHKQSLISYATKFKSKKLLRTSLLNLKQDGDLLNCPLYLISRILDFVSIDSQTQVLS